MPEIGDFIRIDPDEITESERAMCDEAGYLWTVTAMHDRKGAGPGVYAIPVRTGVKDGSMLWFDDEYEVGL